MGETVLEKELVKEKERPCVELSSRGPLLRCVDPLVLERHGADLQLVQLAFTDAVAHQHVSFVGELGAEDPFVAVRRGQHAALSAQPPVLSLPGDDEIREGAVVGSPGSQDAALAFIEGADQLRGFALGEDLVDVRTCKDGVAVLCADTERLVDGVHGFQVAGRLPGELERAAASGCAFEPPPGSLLVLHPEEAAVSREATGGHQDVLGTGQGLGLARIHTDEVQFHAVATSDQAQSPDDAGLAVQSGGGVQQLIEGLAAGDLRVPASVKQQGPLGFALDPLHEQVPGAAFADAELMCVGDGLIALVQTAADAPLSTTEGDGEVPIGGDFLCVSIAGFDLPVADGLPLRQGAGAVELGHECEAVPVAAVELADELMHVREGLFTHLQRVPQVSVVGQQDADADGLLVEALDEQGSPRGFDLDALAADLFPALEVEDGLVT